MNDISNCTSECIQTTRQHFHCGGCDHAWSEEVRQQRAVEMLSGRPVLVITELRNGLALCPACGAESGWSEIEVLQGCACEVPWTIEGIEAN
jgi:hypothetical protein